MSPMVFSVRKTNQGVHEDHAHNDWIPADPRCPKDVGPGGSNLRRRAW